MILSSADILRILGGSEIIRLSAKIKVVDERPTLSGAEGMCIFISRFPVLAEFEATWTLYIENDGSEPEDLAIAEIKRLLPSVSITEDLFTVVTTTDFLSDSTQRAPERSKPPSAPAGGYDYEERFQGLAEDIQDQMLLVNNGRNGADGRDGRDGRDGKDLVATDADLFDLNDAEQGIKIESGQVLTWDGSRWTNLFVPQTISNGGGGGVKEAPIDGQQYARQDANWTLVAPGGIEEAPADGNYYVRSSGAWVNLTDALSVLGIAFTEPIDAGDFTSGLGSAINNRIYDGGNFTNGATSASDNAILEGGLTTP
jgi:hypothetical protein